MQNQLVQQKQQVLPTTSKAFLETYNPKVLQRNLMAVKTVKQAIMLVTPSVGEIKRTYGVKMVEAYIKVWLIDLNAVLNLKRPLNEIQIDECAMLLCSEYNSITLTDINLVFKRAKTGYYGELLASLSINIILRWFKNYFDEKCTIGAEMSRTEADKFKYYEEKSERSSVVSLRDEIVQDNNYNRSKFDKEVLKKKETKNPEYQKEVKKFKKENNL